MPEPAMKILRRLAFACAFAACSCAFADEAQPALYSFADLYRLAVGAKVFNQGWLSNCELSELIE